MDLTVTKVSLVQRLRRLHCNERQKLEQVVLNHVSERSRGVVVSGAAFQGQGFIPDNVDALNMLQIPERLEDAVAKRSPSRFCTV